VYESISRNLTRSMLELKLWVNGFSDKTPLSDNDAIVRGLFFVYIYGIYEEVIRQLVAETIRYVNSEEFHIRDCSFELYTLALSNNYDSLYHVGNEKKWEKRWDIANRFSSNDIVAIPEETMPTDGKNIRISQLKSIANSFGIREPILPRQEIGHYIEETVENRNKISHGNSLPKEIGRRYTKGDLLSRCEIISEICEHFISIFDSYITRRDFSRSQ